VNRCPARRGAVRIVRTIKYRIHVRCQKPLDDESSTGLRCVEFRCGNSRRRGEIERPAARLRRPGCVDRAGLRWGNRAPSSLRAGVAGCGAIPLPPLSSRCLPPVSAASRADAFDRQPVPGGVRRHEDSCLGRPLAARIAMLQDRSSLSRGARVALRSARISSTASRSSS
jgi:hypothetical protein